LARRASGSFEQIGPLGEVPQLPPGRRCLEVGAGSQHSLARLSDGSILAWGRNDFGQCNVPALPPGLVYVEVSGGRDFSVARRSDGSVVAWGDNRFHQHEVPPLPPGWTYTQLAAGQDFTVALFAPGGFNWSGDGCAGSTGITALSTPALPRTGRTLRVDLVPPPPGPAVVVTGFSNLAAPFGPLPLDLGPFGMPRCALRVSPDVLLPVAGNPAHAILPLPDDPALAGLVFHLQALIVDPVANALGAVMSAAATAVVGS
jgi:hypothetical protein